MNFSFFYTEFRILNVRNFNGCALYHSVKVAENSRNFSTIISYVKLTYLSLKVNYTVITLLQWNIFQVRGREYFLLST